MIERNTTIPTSKSQTFSTATDSQAQVEIHVLQGEREMAPDNKSLGRFILDGILPAPRGMPQIEVTFDIDANGILNVSAVDKGTGKEQKITIQAASGLSDEEVERMTQDAEVHAEEDKQRRETVELVNRADNAAYGAEKLLTDQEDKIDDEMKVELQSLIEALRAELAKDDKDAALIETKMTDLNAALMKVGEKVYAQETAAGTDGSSPNGASEAEAESEGDEAETVEGEFREV